MAVVVLLIDDDPMFRLLMTEILRDLGVEQVVDAGTAAAGIHKARDLRPAAALVDVGLPDRDGIDLANELAALPWRPAVVLTSVDRDAASRIKTGPDGELPFVLKDDVARAPLRRLLGLD
jgi:DNA-binding NarL/FixJ family response regulator